MIIADKCPNLSGNVKLCEGSLTALFLASTATSTRLSVAKQMWATSWKVMPTKVGESVSARMTLLEVRRYSCFHRGISLPSLRSLAVIMLLASVKKPGARQDWASIPYLRSQIELEMNLREV